MFRLDALVILRAKVLSIIIINFNNYSVKDVMGFNPDLFQNEDVHGPDFVHPEDLKIMLQAVTSYCECTH